MATRIPWAANPDGTPGEVWNPVTGCTAISEGCLNCYAKAAAESPRLYGRFGYPADDPFQVTLRPDRLAQPLHWKKPRTVFVCSMGDLFHEDVPCEFIDHVIGIIALSQQHKFLILTKRADRMAEYMSALKDRAFEIAWETATSPLRTKDRNAYGIMDLVERGPLPNLALGVTAENQSMVDERIPLLLQCKAAIRFVSVEPMLGSIQFGVLSTGDFDSLNAFTNERSYAGRGGHGGHTVQQSGDGIDWVICGCESGPNRRPMDWDWARSLRDQCIEADVLFFLKQLPQVKGPWKMPELDGRVWEQRPTWLTGGGA